MVKVQEAKEARQEQMQKAKAEISEKLLSAEQLRQKALQDKVNLAKKVSDKTKQVLALRAEKQKNQQEKLSR